MKKLFILLVIFLSSCNLQIADHSDLKEYQGVEPIDTMILFQPDSTQEFSADEIYWDWLYLIYHCTATQQNASWQAIDNYWKKTLGWKDPGYHFLVMLNGDLHIYKHYDFSGRIYQKDIVNSVKGMNRYSVAVAYVGGIDSKGNPKDTRTPEQKETLAMIAAISIKVNPTVSIGGHRDFQVYTNKACPSFDAVAEYGNTNQFSEMETDTLHLKIMERVKFIHTFDKTKLY